MPRITTGETAAEYRERRTKLLDEFDIRLVTRDGRHLDATRGRELQEVSLDVLRRDMANTVFFDWFRLMAGSGANKHTVQRVQSFSFCAPRPIVRMQPEHHAGTHRVHHNSTRPAPRKQVDLTIGITYGNIRLATVTVEEADIVVINDKEYGSTRFVVISDISQHQRGLAERGFVEFFMLVPRND